MNTSRSITYMGLFAGIVLALTLALTQIQARDLTGQSGKEAGQLMGDRIVLGTVEEVIGDEVKVNTGEVEPRFLPLKLAKEKGFAVTPGESLEILVNDQNLLVDYHPLGKKGEHRIVHGRIATPLPVGHELAVIHIGKGKEESFAVRPQARSKMASIPVGVNVVFLIDETNQIVDATFGSAGAVSQAAEDWMKKSPLKGTYRRLEGTLTGFSSNRVSIRTAEGREQSYAVDPALGEKLKDLQAGQPVILFADGDQKILDLSQPQYRKN